MKKGRISIILILVILLFLGALLYFLYKNGIFNAILSNKENVNYEKNDLFFVTKNNNKYGICKSDGSVVLESKYNVMLRNGNSVYVKEESDSYVFFLNNNRSISLGGKETDVSLEYDKTTGQILPYFILTYGEGDSAIYRIYTSDGVRYANRDFTDRDSVSKFLDSGIDFIPNKASTAVTDLYNVVSTVDYPTKQGRTQYIVKIKEDKNSKIGIVDEVGRIVVDLDCDTIKMIEGKEKGVIIERDNKSYIFLQSEKLIEVDSGFEFVSLDGCIFQKKGDTVNKVYNLNGETVIYGIYNYSSDFACYRTTENVYFFVNEGNAYSLYNLTTNRKFDQTYTNVSKDYLKDYKDSKVYEIGYIYISNGVPYCVDFNNMKEYRINMIMDIPYMLDIGYKYQITED